MQTNNQTNKKTYRRSCLFNVQQGLLVTLEGLYEGGNLFAPDLIILVQLLQVRAPTARLVSAQRFAYDDANTRLSHVIVLLLLRSMIKTKDNEEEKRG